MSLIIDGQINDSAYDKLIQAIAANLEWEVGSHIEGRGDRQYRYIKHDNHQIRFILLINENKLEIIGEMDIYKKDNKNTISIGSDIKIKTSASKTAETIYREIIRKLLPNYIEAHDTAIAGYLKNQAEDAEKQAFATEMADKIDIKLSSNRENFCSGFLKPSGIYLNARFIFPKYTELTIKYLNATQTAALIDALNEIRKIP